MRIVLYSLGTGIACIAVLFFALAFAMPASTVSNGTPVYTVTEGVAPIVTADAWLLFDMETGEVIAGRGEDAVLPIASVTKLMTALVALEELTLDSMVEVSERAVSTEGRAGSLETGERITLRELLFPLLIESSNDAAEVLRDAYQKRGNLPDAMTARAGVLGMRDTVFVDVTGLSPDNHATALNLALLLRYVYDSERYLLDITILPQYVGREHEWHNNNPVSDEEGYQGGKHGFTDEAGRTFAGVFEQKLHEGEVRRVGVIVLGSDDLKSDVGAVRSFAEEHVAYSHTF